MAILPQFYIDNVELLFNSPLFDGKWWLNVSSLSLFFASVKNQKYYMGQVEKGESGEISNTNKGKFPFFDNQFEKGEILSETQSEPL